MFREVVQLMQPLQLEVGIVKPVVANVIVDIGDLKHTTPPPADI